MGQIAEKLRSEIRRSGKALTAIAKDTQITDGQLSRFMRGERGLTIESIERLAKYFGLKLQ